MTQAELAIVQDTRAAWLEARKAGIGGSDAAAVLGVSPWKSPYALFLEKTGLAEEDKGEREFIEWGNRLEPLIAEKFSEVTGRKVARAPGMLKHPRLPFMIGTIDYGQEDGNAGPGVLECKTLGFFRADEWAAEPPLHYQVQLQHYMAVSGLKWGSFAALIGGQKFVWCDVPRNDAFIEALEEQCTEFWRRVETGEAPPIDGSTSTADALKRLYPRDSGKLVKLPDVAIEWHQTIEGCKAEIKAAEAKKLEAENLLKAAIGDASEAMVPGGPHWTYRAQKRAAYTAEETEFRVLRVKKGKKS